MLRLIKQPTALSNPVISKHTPIPLRFLPGGMVIKDAEDNLGHSSAYGPAVVQSALGEYFERQHFRGFPDEALPVSSKTLATFGDAWCKVSASLRGRATAVSDFKDTAWVDAFQIQTGEPTQVPAALVFHGAQPKQDRAVFPRSDSCGGAVSATMDRSFRGAILEFCERQALIATWCGAHQYHSTVDIKFLFSISANTQKLIKTIQRMGELHILNLSVGFDCHCLLAILRGSGRTAGIFYSAGLAANLSLTEAAERAINELWQSTCFLIWAYEANNNHSMQTLDRYLKNFHAASREDTWKKFDFSTHKERHNLKTKDFDISALIRSITNISPNVFATYDLSKDKKLAFCKIVSPDFFTTMELKPNSNWNNHFYKHHLGGKPLTDKFNVPFP